MKVFVVESPAKAKSVGQYLGQDYQVLASYGHVRDLPAKAGSVSPERDFSIVWSVDKKSKVHLVEICKALKVADQLLLATDPDREGEAIAWHIKEVLQEWDALKGIEVKRVVFFEVTRGAVLKAIEYPRTINEELVKSYLTRRILDYLVGFTLSPLLWRKLPGSRSAGRVQSVALRLVDERESEIENFRPQEYWSILGIFEKDPFITFKATLTNLKGMKIQRFEFTNELVTKSAVSELNRYQYHVKSKRNSRSQQSPPTPLTTSTLQQESFKQLGFSVSKTMRIAQHLYEGISIDGVMISLITYMRTDSLAISALAIDDLRCFIDQTFGQQYLPKIPRIYKSKSLNTQESHEAVRPVNVQNLPSLLPLEESYRELYELIWKRSVASQMSDASFEKVNIDVVSQDSKIIFNAVGTKTIFDGFLSLSKRLNTKTHVDEDTKEFDTLFSLQDGDLVSTKHILTSQHFTTHPHRYTEATLVKKLEEIGVGRPSTYAPTISILFKRKYILAQKKHLVPYPTGRLVSSFLRSFFGSYIAYDFTSRLEEDLDAIARGELDSNTVLKKFWFGFSEALRRAEKLKHSDILSQLEKELEKFIFPEDVGQRICQKCRSGTLSLRIGKFGGFLGCSSYPKCSYTRSLGNQIHWKAK